MRNTAKDVVVGVLMVIAFIYLLNPTAGLVELIPDNFPIVGNLDEAGAIYVILNALAYYGIDLLTLFRKRDAAQVVEEPRQK